MSASVLSAGADQNAFDLEVVVFARVNDRVVTGAVLRVQFRFAVDKFELFEREVSLQIGKHNVAAARFDGAINDENVALINAGVLMSP